MRGHVLVAVLGLVPGPRDGQPLPDGDQLNARELSSDAQVAQTPLKQRLNARLKQRFGEPKVEAWRAELAARKSSQSLLQTADMSVDKMLQGKYKKVNMASGEPFDCWEPGNCKKEKNENKKLPTDKCDGVEGDGFQTCREKRSLIEHGWKQTGRGLSNAADATGRGLSNAANAIGGLFSLEQNSSNATVTTTATTTTAGGRPIATTTTTYPSEQVAVPTVPAEERAFREWIRPNPISRATLTTTTDGRSTATSTSTTAALPEHGTVLTVPAGKGYRVPPPLISKARETTTESSTTADGRPTTAKTAMTTIAPSELATLPSSALQTTAGTEAHSLARGRTKKKIVPLIILGVAAVAATGVIVHHTTNAERCGLGPCQGVHPGWCGICTKWSSLSEVYRGKNIAQRNEQKAQTDTVMKALSGKLQFSGPPVIMDAHGDSTAYTYADWTSDSLYDLADQMDETDMIMEDCQRLLVNDLQQNWNPAKPWVDNEYPYKVSLYINNNELYEPDWQPEMTYGTKVRMSRDQAAKSESTQLTEQKTFSPGSKTGVHFAYSKDLIPVGCTADTCEDATYDDPGECPLECLGIKNEENAKLKQNKDTYMAGDKAMLAAFGNVLPTSKDWVSGQESMKRKLSNLREALTRRIRDWSMNGANQWKKTRESGLHESVEDINGSLTSTWDDVQLAKKAWGIEQGQMQKKRNQEYKDYVEDTEEQFHDWYEEAKVNMSLVKEVNSKLLGVQEKKNAEITKEKRRVQVEMAKEIAKMKEMDRGMKDEFRKQSRADRKKISKLEKFLTKAVDASDAGDADTARDFTRKAEIGRQRIETRFARLLDEVDKKKQRDLATMWGQLADLLSEATRTGARADQARTSTTLDGIAQVVGDADKAMQGVDTDVQSAEAGADKLTKTRSDNVQKSTIFRIEQIRQAITAAVHNMTDAIQDVIDEKTIPRAQEAQVRSNDMFARTDLKLDRAIKLSEDALVQADSFASASKVKLQNLVGEAAGGTAGASTLDQAYNLMAQMVGKSSGQGRFQVSESIGAILDEAEVELQALITMANKYKADLTTEGTTSGSGFDQQMVDNKIKWSSEAQDEATALDGRLNANDAAFEQSIDYDSGAGSADEGFEQKFTRVKSKLLQITNVDLPKVISDVTEGARVEKNRAVEALQDVEAQTKALYASQVEQTKAHNAAFTEALQKEQKSIVDGVTQRQAALTQETIADADKRTQEIYAGGGTDQGFLKQRRDEKSEVNDVEATSEDKKREIAALGDDFGPKLTKIDLAASRVASTTKANDNGIRVAASQSFSKTEKKLTALVPPLVDEAVHEGDKTRAKGIAALDELQAGFVDQVGAFTKQVKETAAQSGHAVRPMQDSLEAAKSEFSAEQLGRTSAAQGLAAMVTGTIQQLSVADVAQEGDEDAQAAALLAHKKAMLKKVDELDSKMTYKEKKALRDHIDEMERQMKEVQGDTSRTDAERAADLAKISADMEDKIKAQKKSMTAAKFWQEKVSGEISANAEKEAQKGSALAGHVLAQTSSAGKSAQEQAKAELAELGEEAEPAEIMLKTLGQVQRSLQALQGASERTWADSKRAHKAHSHDAFATAINAFTDIDAQHEAALEKATQAGRDLDLGVMQLDADMDDARRQLNSTRRQVTLGLDTEKNNMDHDMTQLSSLSETGSALVSSLAGKVSNTITSVADDAEEQIETREEESEKREEQLHNAENLQVAAEEDEIMDLAGETQKMSSDHTALDLWLHKFATKGAAFKQAVTAKLAELGYESADLDAAALKQASSARLGIVDMKSDMDKAVDGPVEDAKQAADTALAKIYTEMDEEVARVLAMEGLTQQERDQKIAEIKAKARGSASRIALEAARMRQQEVQLEAEMGRYEAQVEAKKNLLHAKIQAGLLSPEAQVVHDNLANTNTEVHRQYRKAEIAAGNLRDRHGIGSFAETGAATASSVSALDSLNDRLEAEDDALEAEVAKLELRRQE